MKILFIQPTLMAGGIERSLISLLKILGDQEVTLFLMREKGEFFCELPDSVRLTTKPKQNAFIDEKNKTFKVFKDIIKLVLKVTGLYKFVSRKKLSEINIEGDFDAAISFHGMYENGNDILLNNVNAKKKMIFIHSDVSMIKINKKRIKQFYKCDKIILVSQGCKDIFDKKFPELAHKSDFLYNVQDSARILKMSEESVPRFDDRVINIVSVSRLAEEKAFTRSLEVFKKLANNGYKFKWHIIGDGTEKTKIETFVKNNGMSNCVELHGLKTNPYPYMKNADLLYLGSFHESFGIVLIESMIVGTPVLTTRTCAADEIVGEKGFVCDNDEDSIYKSIKYIMDNQNILVEYIEKLKNYTFDTESIKQKFLSILE